MPISGISDDERHLVGMPTSRKSKRLLAIAICSLVLFCAVALIRLVDLTADAPIDLCWSPAHFHDEGIILCGPRNEVIFGKWMLNPNENAMWRYESPVGCGLFLTWFRLWGVGLQQARSLSAILGCFSILLIYLIGRALYGSKEAWIAAALYGLNYVSAMFSRLALLEIPMLFFLLLAAYCFVLGRRFPLANAGAGIAFVLSYLCKPIALFFLAAIGVTWIARCLVGRERRGRLIPDGLLREVGCFAFGVFLAGLGWLLLFAIPHWPSVFAYQGKVLQEALSLKEILNSVATFFEWDFFTRMPVESFLSAAFVAAFLAGYRVVGRRDSQDGIILSWFVIGILAFAAIRYRPTRYLLYLIPPMCIFTAYLLSNMRKSWCREGNGTGTFRTALAWMWLAFVFYGVIFSILKSFDAWIPTIPLAAVLATSVLIVSYLLRSQISRVGSMLLRGRHSHIVPILCASLFIAINVTAFVEWFGGRTHMEVEASRALGRLLPADATLVGSSAAVLCLENRIYTPVYGFWAQPDVDSADAVEMFAATHLLASESELREVQWPAGMPSRLRFLGTIDTKRYRLSLYEIGK